MVDARLDTPAREVARELGIGVLELTADPSAPAGVFGIDGVPAAAPFDDRPDPDAVALLLHTSGTTARPKLVPLTHRQLAASATNVALTLGLTPSRPLPERDAAVPHPRARRRAPRLAPDGRLGGLRPRLPPAALLRLDRRAHADLVHGGPDHARRRPGPGTRPRGNRRAPPAPLHPLVVRGAPGPRPGRARGDVRRAGGRGLRHDRGRAPDGVATRCPRASGSPARSDAPPGRRSPCSTRTAASSARARSARSRSAGRTSSRATRRIRRRTTPRSRTAGSAPATRGHSTTTATSPCRAGSRRSSTGAARRSRRSRSTTRSCATRPSGRL